MKDQRFLPVQALAQKLKKLHGIMGDWSESEPIAVLTICDLINTMQLTCAQRAVLRGQLQRIRHRLDTHHSLHVPLAQTLSGLQELEAPS